jgi:hypothetical protein
MKFNLKEMYQSSDIVAEAVVTNQQVLPIDDTTVKTVSELTLSGIFKGDNNLTSVTVVEMGGPFDLSKVPDIYKQKPGASENPNPSGIVEQTFEGSIPMKNGNTYIVFLQKINGIEKYNLTGTIQGKIKIDKSKNQGVATVDKEHFNEKTFFLQKMFAGKSKEEILQIIDSSIK